MEAIGVTYATKTDRGPFEYEIRITKQYILFCQFLT